jgi:hypothetical protein
MENVMDLKPGYRPDFLFPGYWLYAGDAPIVHLIPGRARPADRAEETIDHVAFRLADHDAKCSKLVRLGIAYSPIALPKLCERRLFIHPPSGILIELVFRQGREGSSLLS